MKRKTKRTAASLAVLSASALMSTQALSGDPATHQAVVSTGSDLKALQEILDQKPGPNCSTGAPDAPGCSAGIEEFCDRLYADPLKGNTDLRIGGRTEEIRLGKDANGFSHAYVKMQEAKVQAKNRMPPDLLKKLEERSYFHKLQGYMASKPMAEMSLTEFQGFKRLGGELSSIWSDSINEVALERMVQRHPDYLKKDPTPPHYEAELKRLEREVSAQIHQAMWAENPRWKKVEADFETVRAEFIQMVQASPSLDEKLKGDWVSRLKVVKLEVPGTDPDAMDYGCAGTTQNAFYTWTKDSVTVCAGYFNSISTVSTLAHELAHGLGMGRSALLHERSSEFGKKMRALGEVMCRKGPQAGCPKEWSELKQGFDGLVGTLGTFEPSVPELRRCLQYEKIDKKPSEEVVQARGQQSGRSMASQVAEADDFLELSKPELMTSDGVAYPNTRFMNPCNTLGMDPETELNAWQLTSGLTLRVMYTAEYACAGSGLSPADRLRQAATVAKGRYAKMMEPLLTRGGEFSPNPFMTGGGYSENSEERFADAMGYRVFARLLKKMPSLEDRRQAYYAASAKFCSTPSLTKLHPEEAQAQKEFSLEPHSEGKQRRLENLIAPIREALGCQKDFEGKECKL